MEGSELRMVEDAFQRYDGEPGKELLAVKAAERALALHLALTETKARRGAVATGSTMAPTTWAERIVTKYNVLAVRCLADPEMHEVARSYLAEAMRLTEPLVYPHSAADAADTTGSLQSAQNHDEVLVASSQQQQQQHQSATESEASPSVSIQWQNTYFPSAAGERAAASMRRLRAVTLNNLGCLERRRGKLHGAHAHFTSAQEAVAGAGDVVATAAPSSSSSSISPALLLNTAAVLAQLGKQEQALDFAHRALETIDSAARSGSAAAAAAGGDSKSHDPRPAGALRALALNTVALALEMHVLPPVGSAAAASHATSEVAPRAEELLETYRTAYAEALKQHGVNDELPRLIERNQRKCEVSLQQLALSKVPKDGPERHPREPHPPPAGAPARGAALPRRESQQALSAAATHRTTSAGTSSEPERVAMGLSAAAAVGGGGGGGALPDLTLTDDESRGVVPELPSAVAVEALLVETTTPAHRALFFLQQQQRTAAAGAAPRAEAERPAGATAALAPQPPGDGRRRRGGPPQRPQHKAGVWGGSSKPPGAAGGTGSPRERDASAAGGSGSGGGGAGSAAASLSSSYIAPPRPVAPLAEGVLDEEAKKSEDLVGYVAQRLALLLRAEEAFEGRYRAAVRVQSLARRFIARAEAARRARGRALATRAQLAGERKAARSVIRFFAMLVRRRRNREEQLLQRAEWARRRVAATIKIQSVARMWLARQSTARLKRFYKRFFISVGKVQCWWRQVRSRLIARRIRAAIAESTSDKLRLERRARACVIIQCAYRKHRAGIRILILHGDEKKALQRDWQRSRTQASVVIQRVWRGHRVRRAVGATLRRIKKCRVQTERTQRRRRAATRIQAAFRGYACHKAHRFVALHCANARVARDRARQNRAALRIQCCFRVMRAKLVLQQRREARVAAKRHVAGVLPVGYQHPVIDLEPWL